MSDPFQSYKSRLFENFDRVSDKTAADVMKNMLSKMSDDQVANARKEFETRYAAAKAEAAARKAAREAREAQERDRRAREAQTAMIAASAVSMVNSISTALSNKKS